MHMNAQTQPAALAASSLNINLTDFIDEFGDELLDVCPIIKGGLNDQAVDHSHAVPAARQLHDPQG